MRQQEPDYIGMPTTSGCTKCRSIEIILIRINIGALLDEETNGFGIARKRGNV
jgi:hypothetical protein